MGHVFARAGVLGMSPPWYKSRSYRARAVREPRVLLQEFGLHLPPHVAINVHDSTADLRYSLLLYIIAFLCASNSIVIFVTFFGSRCICAHFALLRSFARLT